MDTAGRQHTRGLEDAMQARITNLAGLAIGLVIAVLVAPLRGCGGWGADSSACPALPRLTKWPAARSRCNATANAVKGMSLHAPRGLAQDRPRPRAERRTLLA